MVVWGDGREAQLPWAGRAGGVSHNAATAATLEAADILLLSDMCAGKLKAAYCSSSPVADQG